MRAFASFFVILLAAEGCNLTQNLGGSGGAKATGAGGLGGVGGRGGVGGLGVTTGECDGLTVNAPDAPVVIRLVNHTNADIFIGSEPGICSGSAFSIQDPQGTPLVLGSSAPCPNICAGISCTMSCTGSSFCFEQKVTRIPPQAFVDKAWAGTVLEEKTVPGACFIGDCEQPVTCSVRAKPPAVPLTVVGKVWTAADCTTPGCTCTPDDQGTCEIKDAMVGGTPLEATGTLSVGAAKVDVIFD